MASIDTAKLRRLLAAGPPLPLYLNHRGTDADDIVDADGRLVAHTEEWCVGGVVSQLVNALPALLDALEEAHATQDDLVRAAAGFALLTQRKHPDETHDGVVNAVSEGLAMLLKAVRG